MKLIRKSVSNNPKTSFWATVIVILGVLNMAITEYGEAIGLTPKTIAIIGGVILALTLVYNELKQRGIVKRSPIKRLFNIQSKDSIGGGGIKKPNG